MGLSSKGMRQGWPQHCIADEHNRPSWHNAAPRCPTCPTQSHLPLQLRKLLRHRRILLAGSHQLPGRSGRLHLCCFRTLLQRRNLLLQAILAAPLLLKLSPQLCCLATGGLQLLLQHRLRLHMLRCCSLQLRHLALQLCTSRCLSIRPPLQRLLLLRCRRLLLPCRLQLLPQFVNRGAELASSSRRLLS